jgi:branched-chain amino acid transport system ATP-binding protein
VALYTENLVVGYYKDINILQGFSMRAADTQLVCVIGPNGAGKSTLLKTIVGLIRPRQGRVVFDGRDITGAKPYTLPRMGLGYVPQDNALFPNLSVQENLELGTWMFRADKTRARDAINEVYAMFPFLQQKRRAKTKTLSGGQRKMLEIGRALMAKPQVLLLDEPTAGLSPLVAKEIYELIATLRERGITIILVDQNVRQALEVSDYVYILELGQNREEGPKEKFLNNLESVIKGWLTQ